MTLRELKPGDSATVKSLGNSGPIRRRLMDMGITPGINVFLRKVAPLGDPIEITVRGYELSLRKHEAEAILVENVVKGGVKA